MYVAHIPDWVPVLVLGKQNMLRVRSVSAGTRSTFLSTLTAQLQLSTAKQDM